MFGIREMGGNWRDGGGKMNPWYMMGSEYGDKQCCILLYVCVYVGR